MEEDSNLDDCRLVNAVTSAHEWVRQSRPPKGGVASKRKAEKLLQDCLIQLDQPRHVGTALRSNLHKAMGALAEYVSWLRTND